MIDIQQLKNSTKKLVIENLCRICGDSIVFIGSLCDVVYADLPIEELRDIDIKVKLSEKNNFIDNLLTSDFYVYNQRGKRFSVKPSRTYEPIRNFNRHLKAYHVDNELSFKYSYHFFVFGVCIDINFYLDDESIYHRYDKLLIPHNHTKSFSTTFPTNQIDNKFFIQTASSRKKNLTQWVHDKSLPRKEREKHFFKAMLYEHKTIHTKKNTLTNINSYKLPNNFEPIVYRNKNMHDLYRLTTKDALIDHYIAHGITGNRVI